MEESCREGFIHPPLNSTFIALIPKKDLLGKLKISDLSPYAIVSIRSFLKLLPKDLRRFFRSTFPRNNLGF